MVTLAQPKHPGHLVMPTALALLIGGCAVLPEPISQTEVMARVQEDQFKIYADQEQVFKPIDFNEALARSLKYNLDYRLKLMESALSVGLSEVARYDMLPNLLTSAGYTARNNITGSRSFDIINDKAVDRNPPTYTGGQDKQRSTASAEFSWNVLDFGVGYYRAKQKSNEVLIAEERRRRVVQNILSDVRSAYWRAAGAQRLVRDADKLMTRVRSALERSREAEALGLLPTKDALNYQRLLLDAVTLLAARRQELDFAKRELAALMNITPGTNFTVAEIPEPTLMPPPVNVAQLEEFALINRPELRQEDYQVRITAAEAKKQLLYLLPNLSFNLGAQYDSNKYLYNKDWMEASTRVSFNLLRALAIPDTRNAQEAQVKVDSMRRMALSMAILTQVRVAVERYKLTLHELEVAKESNQVDQRMAIYARAAMTSRSDSELEVIRAETRALNSEFQRNAAYAAAQAAFGRIYNAIGLEVVPPILDEQSLEKIGSQLASYIAQIEEDTFATIAAADSIVPPLSIRFTGVEYAEINLPKPASTTGLALEEKIRDRKGHGIPHIEFPPTLATSIQESVARAVERNRIPIDKSGSAHTLSYSLFIDAPRNGVRSAQWHIRLVAPNGSMLGETRYSSTLPANPSPTAITAFVEAATIANLRNIRSWLNPGE